MKNTAATLDFGDAKGVATSDSDHRPNRKGGGMKFVHTSGSRPLDGYTIKRGIGIGGFGEVYFAVSDAGKEVALKRVQRNLDVEMRGVRQCLNLKHANLVALYDIKYDDHGEGWVVMEYVAGESLADVIDRNPNGMPRDDVHKWFAEMAAGVGYLHDHGIVHRDLKPGNVFLDEDVVKIGDYGLSKFISCSRRSGQTESVGTFHYMAPEIGKGIYGKEIDIYALGILLHEMLTGRVPFNGESSQEIMMKHLTDEPDLTGLDEPYRGVIARALRKDPAERFGSVEEMVAALEFRAAPVPQPEPEKPAVKSDVLFIQDELYIADEPEEMHFGPVRQRPGVNNGRAKPPVRGVPVGATVAAAVPIAIATEEPIARAVRQGFGQLSHWWATANLGTPVKLCIVIGSLFLLVMNSEWLIPLSVFLGALYLVYFGLRSVVLALSAPRPPTPVALQPVAARGLRSRTDRETAARAAIANKSPAERFTELIGSLLMGAVVACVVSLVMMVVGGQPLTMSVAGWSFFAWFAVTSVFATWSLLILGKAWETTDGESIRRRFVMLVGGLLIGAAACGIAAMLFVNVHAFDTLKVENLPQTRLMPSMYAADGTPLLPAYLAYFGALFAVLRWWKQVDPLRPTRLSVWATACTVFVAWMLNMFLQFVQPWGVMLAVTVSIAAQLAAPWVKRA